MKNYVLTWARPANTVNVGMVTAVLHKQEIVQNNVTGGITTALFEKVTRKKPSWKEEKKIGNNTDALSFIILFNKFSD